MMNVKIRGFFGGCPLGEQLSAVMFGGDLESSPWINFFT